ncbi:MAG: lipopolysaccharide biosynthesis protein [Beijerinckiaceae bacterium]|nr:lipopolysaccharide biosynthesis protein [Beijerinckiaceae bacterium]
MSSDRLFADEAKEANAPVRARALRSLLRAAASGALGVFAVRILGAALGYALHVALARFLGPADFGVWAFAFTLVIVAGHAASIGFPDSVVRFLTDYIAREDWRRARGQVLAGIYISLGMGAALALLFAGLLVALRDLVPREMFAPLLMAAAILPVFAIQDWMDGASRAIGRPLLAMTPIFVLRPIAILGATAVAAASSDALNAALVMGATLAGVAATAVVQGFAFWRALPAPLRAANATFEWRLWLSASAPLGLVVLADQAGGFADVIALGFLATASETGAYFAAARIISLVALGTFAVSVISGRRLALHQSRNEAHELQAFVRTSTRWTFLGSVVLVLVLAPLGPFLLSLFGRDFVSAAPALTVLALGLLARAASGQAEELLVVLGHQQVSARIAITCALVALAGSFAAAALLGPVGVAAAMALTAAMRSFLFTRAARRLTGLDTFIGRDTFGGARC